MADTLQSFRNSPQEIIHLLQQELAETNREVMALTFELERRVQERTAALKAAQRELELRNARLVAANKELEAFSYSVSHDLRAPLRHIHGFASALKEDCGADLNEQGHDYLDHITRAAEHLDTIISALLTFARSGQQEMRQGPVQFDTVVRRVIAELQPDQGQRKIEWVIGPLPMVDGDEALLRQVWVNLIGNAIKYTRNQEAARIEIGSQSTTDGELVFFVKDNGAGFSMDGAEKLFGLFQRLHGRDEFEGTGLGLANVRRIVERHGGRTWAEGAVGKGATFYFSLPVPAE
jgi:light-regulated signal transduction histidine kinase (bacteriophytochrome)